MLHGRMLRYLDEVVRAGTIRKAASKLNVASTAINRQIIALENELGEAIFERMPRRLRLTASGEILIEHVRETLKDYDRTMQRIAALRGSQQGSVSVATTLGLAAGPMAKIVTDHIAENPRVQVTLRALLSEGITNAVLNGEVQLGLGFNLPAKPGLKTIFAMDVVLGAVVSADHPLASRSSVRLAEVIAYPLILAEKNMGLRNSVDLALSRFSGLPPPMIETNSIEMMRNAVRGANAVTFLNPLDCASDVQAGTLAFLTLAEESVQPQTLRLISRGRDPLDAVTGRFIQHLRTVMFKMA